MASLFASTNDWVPWSASCCHGTSTSNCPLVTSGAAKCSWERVLSDLRLRSTPTRPMSYAVAWMKRSIPVRLSTVFSPGSRPYASWRSPCAHLQIHLPAFYQNPFPEMRSLELDLPTISASEIFHFLKLPNFQEFERWWSPRGPRSRDHR